MERLDWWSLGPLDAITEYLVEGDRGFVRSIKLGFRNGAVIATAMPDTDELDVRAVDEQPPSLLDEIADETASQRAPWSLLLGHKVAWGWRLTNHQGYEDGYELEFKIPGETPRYVLLRMVVEASSITVQVFT